MKIYPILVAAAAQEESQQPGAAQEQPETEEPEEEEEDEEGGDGDPGKASSPAKQVTPNQVNGQVGTLGSFLSLLVGSMGITFFGTLIRSF